MFVYIYIFKATQQKTKDKTTLFYDIVLNVEDEDFHSHNPKQGKNQIFFLLPDPTKWYPTQREFRLLKSGNPGEIPTFLIPKPDPNPTLASRTHHYTLFFLLISVNVAKSSRHGKSSRKSEMSGKETLRLKSDGNNIFQKKKYNYVIYT